MRLWFKGSSFSSTGAAGPGSEGASRAPADRHADAVHLLLALTSGEAREAGELAVHHQISDRLRVERSPAAVELAVHHQVAGRRRARHPSSSSPSIIRLFAGGIFHGGKSHQDAVDGSAAGQGAAGQRKIDLEAEPTTVSTSCRYRVIRQGSRKAAMAASLLRCRLIFYSLSFLFTDCMRPSIRRSSMSPWCCTRAR